MALVGFDDLIGLPTAYRRQFRLWRRAARMQPCCRALSLAQRRGWVEPGLLTGSSVEIRQLAVDLQIDRLFPHRRPTIRQCSGCQAEGRTVQALMKGRLPLPALMKAVLALQSGLRTSRCICQVVLMEIPRDRRRFLLADTGITIRPTLEEKTDILQSLVEVATLLREPDSAGLPRVAAMAASEKPSPAMPDTLEAAELCVNVAGDFPGFLPGRGTALLRPGLCRGRR